MRRINLFSYGMMSLLKLFARVLVIVLAVSLFQQAHSAQAVPVRPPHFDRRAMPEALAAPVRSPKGDAAKPAPDWCFYVLEYHNFTENASQAADYTMTVSALRRDLDFLRDNGYTTVLPRELAAGQLDDGSPLPQKAVLLTFDDGYESNYTLAFPILREYGAKAAISLITSRIDERADGFLTWDECREMAKSGLVEFASHTNDCHIRPDAPGIERKSGEDEETYISRISADLRTSRRSRILSARWSCGPNRFCSSTLPSHSPASTALPATATPSTTCRATTSQIFIPPASTSPPLDRQSRASYTKSEHFPNKER